MIQSRMRTIRLINNMKKQSEFAKEIGLENVSHYEHSPRLVEVENKNLKEEKMFFKSKDSEIKELKERVSFLENLCKEKDGYFSELMSDALRNGSSLAAKHMAERREYLKGR